MRKGDQCMKFENTEVWGFSSALYGMRNALASWNKNDTMIMFCDECCESFCDECQKIADGVYVRIGKNDLELAQRLIRAGSEHRKFLRQIQVWVDITAPLFFFKEFDTYKVGTTSNSTSTMHKLASTPITLDRFEIDDLSEDLIWGSDKFPWSIETIKIYINAIEDLRKKYLETKDKKYWKELIRWLPESWLQTRTINMNYENIYSMIRQRKDHKLNEWSGKDDPNKPNFISWAKSLPYAKELLFLDLED